MRRVSEKHLALCCTVLVISAASYSLGARAGELLYGVTKVNGTLTVRSLDLSNARVEERGSLMQPGDERVSAVFQNQDRSINVIRTSTQRDVKRRASIGNIGIPGLLTDATGGQLAGLAANDSVSSLIIPKSGAPIALIAHYSDTPPFYLVALDPQSWQPTALPSPWLDPSTRYGHLTECPDGAIYASSHAIEDGVHVIQIRLDQATVRAITELSVDGRGLRNDVSDLACARSGKVYALADPDYSGSNSLFEVNLTNGAMTLLRKFEVDRMVFVH